MKFPKRIYANVTKNEIKKGTRMDACMCPVALAINNLVHSTVTVRVGIETANIFIMGIKSEYTISSRLSTFIKMFDAKLKVKPTKGYLAFKRVLRK